MHWSLLHCQFQRPVVRQSNGASFVLHFYCASLPSIANQTISPTSHSLDLLHCAWKRQQFRIGLQEKLSCDSLYSLSAKGCSEWAAHHLALVMTVHQTLLPHCAPLFIFSKCGQWKANSINLI